jgi:hypothetical protein
MEDGIQPMIAAMPAAQNNMIAMLAIHISELGNLPACISMSISFSVVLPRITPMPNVKRQRT